MKYTELGSTGLKVSRLGFGCMRFPMTPEGKVDRAATIPMLHRALELGINYFDTAVFYCNGDSQRTVGEAFEKVRDRVVLSTKNHMHEAPAQAWWARLEESLELLRTDHIDVYNCHGMTWEAWEKHINAGGPNGKRALLEKAKAQGKIRHICCSFHDSPQALVKLGETGFFESFTVQYNLINQSLRDAITRLHELGRGVVVMGPVGGGRLGVDSEKICELTHHEAKNTPEAALRFVLAHRGVCVALSGMSTMAMLDQNAGIVADKEPFTAAQVASIDEEVQRVKASQGVPCTACGYCQPCPFGVDMPANFAILNEYRLYGLVDSARKAYANLGPGNASICTECGSCLPKCPQKIEIPKMLRRVMADLDVEYGQFGGLMAITGASNGTVKARLTMKNLRPDPLAARARIELEDACTADPAEVDFPALPPLGSSGAKVSLRVRDGVGIIEGTVRARTRDGEERLAAVHLPLFLIPTGRTHTHHAKILPEHFSGNAPFAADHGFAVTLSRDEKAIHVTLNVRSQMHALGRIGESGGGRVEMFVDMRPAEAGFATAPYTDGAEQFFLSLGEPGHGTKSTRQYPLRQRNQRTAEGVIVSLELPFAEFLKPEWPQPTAIGLDFMFVAHDQDGRELGHPTYGGRQGLWQNPRAFTRAYLI